MYHISRQPIGTSVFNRKVLCAQQTWSVCWILEELYNEKNKGLFLQCPFCKDCLKLLTPLELLSLTSL